ncbi:hypothetical protein [Sphingobacterium sp. LRF_L2]|uniref:hypothetical protein n=1 Tax=Sphingobacterium sp. LRF_L2 TaxID=3369421 RepID=UPI003F5DF853
MVRIIAIVAAALGYGVAELTIKGQSKQLLYARYITIAVLKEEGYETGEISHLFGYSENHTRHHCAKAFNDLLDYNKEFKNMYLKAVKAVEDNEYEGKANAYSA